MNEKGSYLIWPSASGIVVAIVSGGGLLSDQNPHRDLEKPSFVTSMEGTLIAFRKYLFM